MSRIISLAIVTALSLAPYGRAVSAQQFALGAPVSDFSFQDMQGRSAGYKTHTAQVTVVMFFPTRCPLSNAFNYRRNTIYNDYKDRIRFIVIDPNANESLKEIEVYSRDTGFNFPVYRDVNNEVADQFNVWTTTDTFVIDSSGIMRYHGYIEDSPNPERSKKQGLRLAITAVLDGTPVEMPEGKTRGCAIRRASRGNITTTTP